MRFILSILFLSLAISAKILTPISSITLSQIEKNRSTTTKQIRGFIKLRKGSSISNLNSNLNSLGAQILSQKGEIITLSCPQNLLKEILLLPEIVSFSTGEKLEPTLDSSKYFGNAENLHSSATHSLSIAGTIAGKGVIVGIVDVGFQYTHPVFTDKNGKCRISRVWDQNVINGSPPSGYNYGKELIGSEQILAKGHCDVSEEYTHATHVAAIAGGRKVVNSLNFGGIAYESELVFVSTTLESNDIFDGVNYILKYAKSVGKPAVINLSLGSSYGPHDGSSNIDKGYLQLSKEGAIIINSAGNSGNNYQHFTYNFKGGDTVKTYTGNIAADQKYLDFWGEYEMDFSITPRIVKKNSPVKNSSVKDSLVVVATLPPIKRYSSLFDTVITIKGEADLQIYTDYDPRSSLNGKSEILISVLDTSNNYWKNYAMELVITANKPGILHGWNSSYENFLSQGREGFIDGDKNYTLSSGACAEGVISVGSSNSRNSYFNIDGDEVFVDEGGTENISAFSAKGPTIDGRVKPDITAPGSKLISAFNLFSDELYPVSVTHKFNYNGENYLYGAMQGTSMSAPFVTGAVACMLQIDSSLTLKNVLEILKKSATTDSFTGNISVAGSNSWGHGKISVQRAIDETEKFLSYKKESKVALKNFYLYPTKIGSKVKLIFSSPLPVGAKILLWDAKGRVVSKNSIKKQDTPNIIISSLASGVYVYKMIYNGDDINFLGDFSSSSNGKILVY